MADDAVWERLLSMMPLHDCGQRLQPGSDPRIGHVLVCLPCSHVAVVDPFWVTAQVNEAILSLTEESPDAR